MSQLILAWIRRHVLFFPTVCVRPFASNLFAKRSSVWTTSKYHRTCSFVLSDITNTQIAGWDAVLISWLHAKRNVLRFTVLWGRRETKFNQGTSKLRYSELDEYFITYSEISYIRQAHQQMEKLLLRSLHLISVNHSERLLSW